MNILQKIILSAAPLLFCFSASASKPLGTDVSAYQPANIDWVNCKNHGIAFAYIKATESSAWTSSTMASQIAGANAQGIPVGLYHFARPNAHPNITGANSADTEAQHFLDVAGPYIQTGGKYLIPMLDWEDPYVTNVSSTVLNETTMSQWVNEWCYYVSNYARSKGITMKCMVYSGTWYCAPGSGYRGGLNSTVTQWPNAMSGYPSNPNAQTGAPSTSPWSTFTVWQYADTNWSGGDSDVFNGTTNQMLQTLAIGGNGAPIITNDLDSITVDAGSNATFSLGLTGNAPLTFRWYFNGANIATTTAGNFTVTNVNLPNAGYYYVSVSNSLGTTTSSTAYLSVIAPSTNAPGAVIAPSGIVDFWPCQGNLDDIYGGNTLTPHGNLTYTTGKTGLGIRFDASTSYLTSSAASIAAPWTLSLWVNRRSNTSISTALFSDATFSIKLDQYNGTHQVGISEFNVGDYPFGYTTPAGVWTHLVLVGTQTNTSLYANGNFVSSLTNTIALPRKYVGVDYFTSTGAFLDYLPASLDEIIMFNRVLSPTEISNLYSAGAGSILHGPELTSIIPVGNNVQVNMAGLTGKTFTIYKSTDLMNWTNAGRFSSSTGTLQFFDSVTTSPLRFYSITQP